MNNIANLIASGDYEEAISLIGKALFKSQINERIDARAHILLKAAWSGVWLLDSLQTPDQQNACRVMIESLIQEARRILIAS